MPWVDVHEIGERFQGLKTRRSLIVCEPPPAGKLTGNPDVCHGAVLSSWGASPTLLVNKLYAQIVKIG